MEGNQGYRGRFATHVPTSRSMYNHETLSVPISTLSNNNTAPISIQPGISQVTHLSLAIVFTALFALLFLMILLQLCLILYFGHRRLSYQTVFLFIYLFWASLRTTLFSFYFNDSSGTDSLSLLLRWLLFSLPIYLQFLTLSLLTLYLSKVVLRARRVPLDPVYSRKYLFSSFAAVNTIFLAINISSAFFCPRQDAHEVMVIVRVVINGFLFVLVGIVLCFCIIKGASTRQGIILCVLVVLLYLSRVIYNLVAVTVPHDVSSFGFGWINVSDEGEIKYNASEHASIHEDIRDREFITFGVVLIVWEVLPTFMVVWFFRVRKPNIGDMGPTAIASQSCDKKSYFFDNPRRYDSDEDLTVPHGEGKGDYNIPGVLSPSNSSGVNVGGRAARSFGSGIRSGSFQRSNSASNLCIPGTTPPQLFTAGSGYQPNVLVEEH
ncbi:G protein-coupled receptor 137Ba-like isoform X2 [Acropora palmata]|uniref:G protein-coupled receptor 137Ba-like isoform X2 n=1 Tax=Acropora palmata TaxID=6131 RepID=UPI003DA1412C